MTYLLDTNVLVYAGDRVSPFHDACRGFRDRAVRGEIFAVLTATVLNEFYAIVTDDRRVRCALSPEEALREIQGYRQTFRLIHPTDVALEHLGTLIERHVIRKQDVFDAFLVATMLEHGVEAIYTANLKDFERFEEIHVEGPQAS